MFRAHNATFDDYGPVAQGHYVTAEVIVSAQTVADWQNTDDYMQLYCEIHEHWTRSREWRRSRAAQRIQRAWRRLQARRREVRAHVCAEVRALPGIGVDFVRARDRFTTTLKGTQRASLMPPLPSSSSPTPRDIVNAASKADYDDYDNNDDDDDLRTLTAAVRTNASTTLSCRAACVDTDPWHEFAFRRFLAPLHITIGTHPVQTCYGEWLDLYDRNEAARCIQRTWRRTQAHPRRAQPDVDFAS